MVPENQTKRKIVNVILKFQVNNGKKELRVDAWWLIGFVDWLQAKCQSQRSTHDRKYGLSYINKLMYVRAQNFHMHMHRTQMLLCVVISVARACVRLCALFSYCLWVECKSSADLLTNNAIRFWLLLPPTTKMAKATTGKLFLSLSPSLSSNCECASFITGGDDRALQSINYLIQVCELFKFTDDGNCCCCWCIYSGFLR